MKDTLIWLKYILYAVLFLSVSILLNDLRDFDQQQLDSFLGWAKTADKNRSWFTSENALKWSFYVINAALFFFRGYLIYGIYQFVNILKNVENGHYFNKENIDLFKKIGNIFITYGINVFVLKGLLAYISDTHFIVGEEFIILIPAGLGFYLLSAIFKKAQKIEQENELTI